MKTQDISSKLGEIKYRSQIVNQHLGKKEVFENEATYDEFILILKKRLRATKEDFKNLKRQKLLSSPFLEVGAEYALASSLLTNKFKEEGFALDISASSLKHAKDFARVFKFKKLPKLICADIESLPFPSNYFPFIFVYESLHHFPNPKNPLKSLNRVLRPGGTLLIGSEPIKPSLKLNLWNRPNKLRLWEKVLKAILILPFISHIGKTEIEHGIIETSFSIQTWLKTLSIFDKADITIDVYPFGPLQKLSLDNMKLKIWTVFLLFFLGGSLKAICTKEGKHTTASFFFICPQCLSKNGQESKLTNAKGNYFCPSCQTIFKKAGQIPIFLPAKVQTEIKKINK